MMEKINKVFLVDDDETSNFLNQILIKDMDVVDNVVVAKNGKEALQKFREYLQLEEVEWPELILLDINMPVMDGFEFLEEISKYEEIYPTKVKVFLLTSSDSQKDIERAKHYQISGYINKPLTEEKLVKIINETKN